MAGKCLEMACDPFKHSNFLDQLQIQCKAKHKQLNCERMKETSKWEDRLKFIDCGDRDKICDYMEPNWFNEVISCGAGVGGVIYRVGEGLILLGPTVFKLAMLNANDSARAIGEVFRNCYDRVEDKRAYMGDLIPPEMTEESLKAASCADIQKMTREKVKVLLIRVEEKRQAAIMEKGHEDVSLGDLSLTAQELHALNFSLDHAGLLRKAACFSKEDAIKTVCGELTKVALVLAGPKIASAAARGGMEVLRKVASMSPSAQRAATVAQAIENNSAAALGTSYPHNKVFPGSPLGEGPTGTFSTRPLVCKSSVDCVTFVEQTVASSLATTPAETIPILNKIRYKDANISYPTRNHFTDADWIPNNIANGVFDDVTAQVAGNTTKVVEATVDKGQWLRNKKISDVQRDISYLDKKQVIDDLRETAKGIKPQNVSIPVVPIEELIKNPEVLSRIPSGTVFSIVRNSTNWTINGKSYPVGTVVNHQGLLIVKNGQVYVRHASSVELKVVDAPLVEYMKNLHRWYPDIAGLNILRATGHVPY